MTKNQDFCLKCGGSRIERFEKEKRLMFHCFDCGQISSRVLTFDDSRLVKTKKGYKHFSIGAIIQKRNRILIIFPHNFPFEYKFPSGHIKKGETPRKALYREVKEETGLNVVSAKLLFHEILDWDSCSRGVDIHEWYLFKVKVKGRIDKFNKEVIRFKWFLPKKIKNLKINKVYQYWLQKSGLIKGK